MCGLNPFHERLIKTPKVSVDSHCCMRIAATNASSIGRFASVTASMYSQKFLTALLCIGTACFFISIFWSK